MGYATFKLEKVVVLTFIYEIAISLTLKVLHYNFIEDFNIQLTLFGESGREHCEMQLDGPATPLCNHGSDA